MDSKETAAAFMMGESNDSLFLLDSGVSAHMCSQSKWFDDLKSFSGSVAFASKNDFFKNRRNWENFRSFEWKENYSDRCTLCA